MPLNLKSLFSAGAEKLVSSIGNAIDQNFTSKEEREAAKLAIEKEMNRHFEQLQENILKENELENADRDSARRREADFVKATGRADFMQIFVGVVCMVAFMATLVFLIKVPVPEKNEHILINAVGILEGLVLSVATYYFGSSAGSRLKDHQKK